MPRPRDRARAPTGKPEVQTGIGTLDEVPPGTLREGSVIAITIWGFGSKWDIVTMLWSCKENVNGVKGAMWVGGQERCCPLTVTSGPGPPTIYAPG